MHPLTSLPLKLTTLMLSAALTLSLSGAVVKSFQHAAPSAESMIVQLPTVVVVGHRDAVVQVPDTLQAKARVAVKPGA